MPHEIGVLEEGIVEVVHTGQMSMQDASASRKEAGALMEELDLRLVVIDVRETVLDGPDTVDVFEFNASWNDDFPSASRVACVISADPAVGQLARFGETVAQNRGFTMKLFLDAEDALSWLKEPPSDAIGRM